MLYLVPCDIPCAASPADDAISRRKLSTFQLGRIHCLSFSIITLGSM